MDDEAILDDATRYDVLMREYCEQLESAAKTRTLLRKTIAYIENQVGKEAAVPFVDAARRLGAM